jgi:hypothetical protein
MDGSLVTVAKFNAAAGGWKQLELEYHHEHAAVPPPLGHDDSGSVTVIPSRAEYLSHSEGSGSPGRAGPTPFNGHWPLSPRRGRPVPGPGEPLNGLPVTECGNGHSVTPGRRGQLSRGGLGLVTLPGPGP